MTTRRHCHDLGQKVRLTVTLTLQLNLRSERNLIVLVVNFSEVFSTVSEGYVVVGEDSILALAMLRAV